MLFCHKYVKYSAISVQNLSILFMIIIHARHIELIPVLTHDLNCVIIVLCLILPLFHAIC